MDNVGHRQNVRLACRPRRLADKRPTTATSSVQRESRSTADRNRSERLQIVLTSGSSNGRAVLVPILRHENLFAWHNARSTTIERTTKLRASVADAFYAVNSPETAPLIDPRVRIWTPDIDPIGVGTRFAIRARLGLITIRGVSETVTWNPPTSPYTAP